MHEAVCAWELIRNGCHLKLGEEGGACAPCLAGAVDMLCAD